MPPHAVDAVAVRRKKIVIPVAAGKKLGTWAAENFYYSVLYYDVRIV